MTVTLDDVRAAAALLTDVAVRTPIESSRPLSALLGRPVLLKAENLQRAGSFKIRGAYVRISHLSAQEKARGVVAASAGNHAQGVALAASLLGTTATVFMPEGAPLPKLAATRDYGARIELAGTSVESALEAARAYSERTGAVLIHPFDHPDIVAGQGTLGLELLEQVPDASTIVVPVGGGGLIAGVALAVRTLRPDVRIVGVQSERVAPYPVSLAEGRPTSVVAQRTMADGIAVSLPGHVPYEEIARYVDRIVTVTEEALSEALLLLLERAKLVVEPAGAAGVAAIMQHPELFADDSEGPLVCVLSGGNIDPLLLMNVVRHGLAAAGRFLSFRVRISDRPGSLEILLRVLAEMAVSVLDVIHERTSSTLAMDEVEVTLSVETRGPEHRFAVEQALRDQGYVITYT
ncbi:threonine ammonia-lyase [Mumia sp. zg.B53]|uniref:threonine ammonia-lyase n=1 Tax=unclassified Mumia TaxID=2621872 RepID=UPI001C6DD50A|nr:MULTISPECIES: threonine ammonia-lyase [unclassified Mumia]MBW9206882.1 threonine ammonia-lyase [Mumia sp. zg.B17]MBW9210831.1 threonine ammonia-lyase [Mumia sp. zg.B21]MBW9215396.1 threonine ammonia-lyase [Mumia sp. zg.B53]MDD9349076.1 threonine ammonia-lyase [Mumia sp.]